MGLMDTVDNFLSGGKQGDATAASQAAVDAFKNVNVPGLEEQQLQLQQLVSQGVLTPEQAQTYSQQASAMGGVQTDPRLQQAQLGALSQLQQMGNQGGMTAQDQDTLNQVQSQEQANNKGQQDAIMQNMAARGMSGSGMQLAAQLSAQQGDANMASQQGSSVAAAAQQRALQAIQDSGTLAANQQATSFNQQSAQAQAQDAINRFNTANQQTTQDANVAANNQAKAANLTNAQQIANQNAATANQQQVANKGLYQQQFSDQMQKAGGTASAYQNQAASLNNQGQQNMQLIGTGISAGAKAMSGGATAAAPAAAAHGGRVPGVAPVRGDSSRNDTSPTMLSAGEVVLPRTVATNPSKAASFVSKINHAGPAGNIPARNQPLDMEDFMNSVTGSKFKARR